MKMEIREIVSYYVNKELNLLEVSFRTIDDSDDVVRNDQIDYSEVKNYGFELETDFFDLFNDVYNEENDDFLDFTEDEVEIDEDELLLFLNEYYTINESNLPKPQLS
jgi:hypothetical protein